MFITEQHSHFMAHTSYSQNCTLEPKSDCFKSAEPLRSLNKEQKQHSNASGLTGRPTHFSAGPRVFVNEVANLHVFDAGVDGPSFPTVQNMLKISSDTVHLFLVSCWRSALVWRFSELCLSVTQSHSPMIDLIVSVTCM